MVRVFVCVLVQSMEAAKQLVPCGIRVGGDIR